MESEKKKNKRESFWVRLGATPITTGQRVAEGSSLLRQSLSQASSSAAQGSSSTLHGAGSN